MSFIFIAQQVKFVQASLISVPETCLYLPPARQSSQSNSSIVNILVILQCNRVNTHMPTHCSTLLDVWKMYWGLPTSSFIPTHIL